MPWWLFLFFLHLATSYDLVRDYSGARFFDLWSFYGNYDNTTLGDVVWLNRVDAFSQGIAYVNRAGNAILKVDNSHNVAFNQKRASVRITSQHAYAVGSLWITDMVHIPFGCSVWPAFWTNGPKWPDDGEIDIIEAINLMDHNQMALHTTKGCIHSTPPNQMGTSGEVDCSTPAGCTVAETAPNSYGPGFAQAGGGVFAAQFDVTGIFIWFWSRTNIPNSIRASTHTSSIDVSDWGPPSASYPSIACNIAQFFRPQNLVLDITLCGKWAGIPSQYLPQCASAGPTGHCYNDNVVGSGSNYNNAYFEISYIRAYTTGGVAPIPTAPAGDRLRPSTLTAVATQTQGIAPVETDLGPSVPPYPPNNHINTNADVSSRARLYSMIKESGMLCGISALVVSLLYLY